MKTILLTTVLLFCAAKSFAQTTKVDLKDILLERRDKISGNEIIILKDGTFQLKTKDRYYKFDAKGSQIGTPEENPFGGQKYRESAESHFDDQNDINYYYDGVGAFYVTKFKSAGPNEYASVPFPKFADLSSAGAPVYNSLKTLDADNFILLSAYKGRTTATHGNIPVNKDNVDFFIRIVKINIRTKEVKESFRFINKLGASKKDFNTIDVVSFALIDHTISVGVLLANSKRPDESLGTYTELSGSYQVWNIDLDSDSEEKITSVPLQTTDKTRYATFYFSASNVAISWTETLNRDAYALFHKQLSYADGSWNETYKAFPQDVLTLAFPGYPLPVSDYKFPDGEMGYKVVGVIAKGPLDKNPKERIFLFNEQDEVTTHDIKKSSSLWYKDEMKGGMVDYEWDHQVSDELIVSLTAPLLEKSKMHYIYYGSGCEKRAVDGNLMLIHYDWRATNTKPDYMLEITQLPL